MKQILKNILICVSITYLLISLVYNIFYTQIAKETLKTNTYAQGLVLEGNVETYEYEYIQNAYTRGGLNQGYQNLQNLIISAVIGIIFGLFISLKENSKVKYVLYFIFGNILYNSIWLVIITTITNNYLETTYVDNWFYYLYKSYTSTYNSNLFIKTFLSYILIYAVILIGNIINNKKKVEELNRSLKGEQDIKTVKRSKNIKRSIIIISIIIVTIFTGNIIRKVIIINKYTNAVENINESNNYYWREQREDKYDETYYKDGICVSKTNGILKLYENETEKQTIVLSQNNNRAYVVKDYTRHTKIENHIYDGYETKYWHNVVLAFRTKIKTEKIDGKSCYVIEIYNQKLYIDKKDNMLFKIERESTYTKKENGKRIKETKITTHEYSYKMDAVTNQDITMPDLTGYEIINK